MDRFVDEKPKLDIKELRRVTRARELEWEQRDEALTKGLIDTIETEMIKAANKGIWFFEMPWEYNYKFNIIKTHFENMGCSVKLEQGVFIDNYTTSTQNVLRISWKE